MPSVDMRVRHKEVLDAFPLSYFQACDVAGAFPVAYFHELRRRALLGFHIINERHAADFHAIVDLIAASSVGAALSWVMHNQQVNALRALDRANINEMIDGGGLFASITSRGAGCHEDGLFLQEDGYRLTRSAPASSYCGHADYFLVVAPHAPAGAPAEDWMVLVPSGSVAAQTDAAPLNANRTTATFPVKINCRVEPSNVLGPLRQVFADIFVPIAHIGWMAAYNGGLGGVLTRLRATLRSDQSLRHRLENDHLFRHRVGRAVAAYHANAGLLRDGVAQTYAPCRSTGTAPLNVIKVAISEAVSRAAQELSEALGMRFALLTGDALGLEAYARDVRAAGLMVHNDHFYNILFGAWLTKQD